MYPIRVIFFKEIKDILRDRRALITVSLVSILAGPILLIFISNMLAGFEARAERRIVLVYGIQHAPSLANALLRDSAKIEDAPPDYELAIQQGRLNEPVLVIPEDFELNWIRGQPQTIQLVTDSSKPRVNAGVGRARKLVSGFLNERNTLQIILRGVAPNAQSIINLEEIDLANSKAEGAKIFGMLPYFFILAALYGVWGSAIDTTAGERERSTLESLLVTGHPVWKILLGKWLAVFFVGSLVVTMSITTFIPAQIMMQSDTLKSMFAFGWYEATICLFLSIPLCGLLASVLMLVGSSSYSMRQAQANSTLVLLLITFFPLFMQLQAETDNNWKSLIPVIAQHYHTQALMERRQIEVVDVFASVLVCVAAIILILLIASRNIKKHPRI